MPALLTAFTRPPNACSLRASLDMHPTYFETVTAMAFVVFADAKLDTVVLEVGLGGRLDATNVVTPELCVITPIDYDHQMFIWAIPSNRSPVEKAGILKPGVPAVFAEQRPEAEAVLRAQAQGPYTFSRDWPITDLAIDARGSRFRLRGVRVVCPLAGEHQVENARVAAIALDRARRLACTVLPRHAGRRAWSTFPSGPRSSSMALIIPLDVRALAAYIRRFYSGRRIWIVYGAHARQSRRGNDLDAISPRRSDHPDRARQLPRHAARGHCRRRAPASRIPSPKPSHCWRMPRLTTSSSSPVRFIWPARLARCW